MREETHESVLAEMQQRSDLFNYGTIEQVLEIEEEGSHDFTNAFFANGYEQVEPKLKELNEAHGKGDMLAIVGTSHFLKGSFAQMGAKRACNIIFKVNNLGKHRSENGDEIVEKSDALKRIGEILQSGDKDIKDTLSYYQRLSKLS